MIDFNHIDKTLSDDEVAMLKLLYTTYGEKRQRYKREHEKFKRRDLLLTLTATTLTLVGGGVGIVALPALSLTGVGVIISMLSKKKNYPKKIEMRRIAYTSYEKIQHRIKSYLRGGSYDENMLIHDLRLLDDLITDMCAD